MNWPPVVVCRIVRLIGALQPKETTHDYVIHPEAGDVVPSFMFNRYLGSNLSFVTEIQEYFQELTKMEDDADNGKALGVRLMQPGGEKGKKPQKVQTVRDGMRKHRGLHQLRVEFDWLVGFLEAEVGDVGEREHESGVLK